MKTTRYLALAAVPLAAVWLFAVGQSMRSLVSMIDAVPARAADARAADPAAVAREPGIPSGGAAPAVFAAPVPARLASRPEEIPAQLPPAVYASEVSSATQSAELPVIHPEITDPQLRRLLQPAWDD